MLMPKRTKFRRVQRGRMKGAASRGNKVSYGEFGIQALEPGWITGNQIEAARIAMTRYTKRSGQVWIKIFPDKPVSKKALGVRMGSGKGARNTGSPLSRRRRSCSRSAACLRRMPVRRSVWHSTSCPSRPRSSPGKMQYLRMVVNNDEGKGTESHVRG